MRIFRFFILLLLVSGCAPQEHPQVAGFSVAYIGSSEPPPPARIQQLQDTFCLRGQGEFLTETKDDFTFAWTPIMGSWTWDVELEKISPGTLAGIMIRTSQERGASNFFAGTPGDGILVVQTRLDKDGYTYHPLPMRLPAAPLHFHLEKQAEGLGLLQVRDATGFLLVFSFPDFVADTLLVGIALKGPEGSFVSFTQPPVGSLKPRQHQPVADTLRQPSCPDLKIVSHRGATYAAPENSLLSRSAAVHCDADIIELDLRLTSDGVAVVIHDDFLDRSTNGRGDVSSHTWAGLQKLRLRNPDGSVSTEKIPSLTEYLSSSGHQGAWLLDKAWPIREQLAPTLLQMGILPRCVFKGTGSALEAQVFLSSFDETKRPQYLHLIRDSIPALRLDSLLKMKITGFDLQTTDSAHFMLQPVFAQRLRASEKVLMMSPFVPQFAAGQSERWYPYPCWKWLTDHGVTWMQTDLPCELRDWRDGQRH